MPETAEIRDCEIDGESAFVDCVFNGSSLAGSTVNGLRIQRCRFDSFIVVEDARFNELRLENTTFGPGFEVDGEGVVYVDSDQFPG